MHAQEKKILWEETETSIYWTKQSVRSFKHPMYFKFHSGKEGHTNSTFEMGDWITQVRNSGTWIKKASRTQNIKESCVVYWIRKGNIITG